MDSTMTSLEGLGLIVFDGALCCIQHEGPVADLFRLENGEPLKTAFPPHIYHAIKPTLTGDRPEATFRHANRLYTAHVMPLPDGGVLTLRAADEGDSDRDAQIIDVTHTAMLVLEETSDRAPIITYANRAAEGLFGYSAAELAVVDIREILHPDTSWYTSEAFLHEFNCLPLVSRFEAALSTPSGDIRWVACTAAYLDLPHTSVLLTALDITERKAMVSAVHRREQEFRSLAENSPDLIARVDRRHHYAYVNPALEALLAEEPDLLGTLKPATDAVFRSGERKSVEFTAQLAGATHHFQAQLAPELGKKGYAERVLIITRDVTDLKRAENAERKQRVLAEALRDTAASINSTLEMDDVLERILDNVERVVPHEAASIALFDDGQAHVIRSSGMNSPIDDEKRVYPIETTPEIRMMIETGRPLIIEQFTQQAHPQWATNARISTFQSAVLAPIFQQDEVAGFISLLSKQPDFFTSVHAEHLKAFTDQAGVAISNARRYEESKTLAAMEERNRLARELHDAVSQTLYSANLITATLPELLTSKPERVRESLWDLQRMTSSALAEMRTMLMELRPERLKTSSLEELLDHLITAFTSRTGMDVQLEVQGQADLPAEVQIAMYRITQEALNNILHHAHAGHATVSLQYNQYGLRLTIEDDGSGFILGDVPSSSIGLSVMQERAQRAGAVFGVDASPQEGTRITVNWER